MLRHLSPTVLMLALLGGTATGQGKYPFTCFSRQLTLREELESAAIVIHGKVLTPGRTNNTDEWITPIEIKTVLKKHPLIDKAKHINLRRELHTKEKDFLIFADIYKNDEVDAYRGIPATAGTVKYMHGIIDVKGKPLGERLRFYFEHLEHKESEIAEDAHREFADLDCKHLALLAKNLAADRIAGWLDNIRKTGVAKHRIHLYAHLLGLTGQAKHAPLLKKMIDAKEDWPIDGLLLGYTLLAPKEGWQTLVQVASEKDEPEKSFFRRYAALRAARLVHENYDRLWSKDKRDALNVFLSQDDIADLWIGDLRKMKAWDLSDRVLDLWEAKPEPNKVTKRAIVYFALRNPAMRAQAFIREQRQRDAEFIRDLEELLELEDPPAK